MAHVTGAVVGLLQIFVVVVALVNKICVLKAPWAETQECVVISTSEVKIGWDPVCSCRVLVDCRLVRCACARMCVHDFLWLLGSCYRKSYFEVRLLESKLLCSGPLCEK